MLSRSNLLVNRLLRQNVKFYHDHGGVPGANLPFSINNRYKLTAIFIAFFGSGFAGPFLILRHQLLKA